MFCASSSLDNYKNIRTHELLLMIFQNISLVKKDLFQLDIRGIFMENHILKNSVYNWLDISCTKGYLAFLGFVWSSMKIPQLEKTRTIYYVVRNAGCASSRNT